MSKLLGILVMVLMTTAVRAETPRTYKYRFGDIKVSALANRQNNVDKSLFRTTEKDLLAGALSAPDANRSGLNEFVMDFGDKVVLFDTGIEAKPVIDGLKEAGYSPDDIDVIVITHMHSDHVGGLLDDDFGVVFKNADVYISREELDANPTEYYLRAYGDRIKPFEQNVEIIPGIKSYPAFGHTPGHTVFEVVGGDRKIVIWGDIIHALIQFDYPEIYLTYDSNPGEARAMREKLLRAIALDGAIVAGMHLVYPGMGTIDMLDEEANRYQFEPLK